MTTSPTVDESVISAAASRLAVAERTGVPCGPVRDLLAPTDVAAAYAVQRVNVERGAAAGRRIVGRKTGLTSKAVQRQLGVGQPDFGALFADMCVADGDEIPAGRLLQPKVEAEVALVLGADLPDPRVTVVDVLRAVEFALPALEIVDSRVAGWDITIVDTIADNASCGLFVLGATPAPLDRVDLRAVEMRLLKGEHLVSRGTGSDCLGGPLNAAVWLAATLAAAGDPLRAGDVVLTGALGPMIAAGPGDAFETEISGLGSVRTRFASEAAEGEQR
ncbi:2-keto-4-pentenoate hydratase [Pseudofrankia inefficax]|uniref:2-oxopent-4-enoate hydratase n=1 Tax=Pseudofrankia inefficax (strain DSM 45817 / CECT 9037 / DDB 130130 / EuI1c) TaxID=298654 RepID=E3J988_PSEI1|nr:fumarylacetoacetate hydrolase family protein [Pseudofrankia inefficax]ADP82107.1 2-oxopent-4-enoate hydratase [Pseudofrankia inefficax]